MKVMVNGRCVMGAGEDGATLGALLGGLRARGDIPGDEVVVALEVDRSPCGAQDLDTLADVPLREASEVSIATDDMPGYARRILTDARSMLSVLEEATGRLAAEFREEDPSKANADLFNLLNAIQSFFLCIYHVSNTCGMAPGLGDPGRQLLSQVSASLDALQASQESKDWASLAGRLESELLPALRGFDAVLVTMASAIT